MNTHVRSFTAKFLFATLLAVFSLTGFFIFSFENVFASGLQRQSNNLGLVGFWSFEDGSGTKATDFSGNGNTGTLIGHPPSWVQGKHGRALSFLGSDGFYDGVIVDSVASSIAAGPVTISAWVNFPAGYGNGSLASNVFRLGDGPSDNDFGLSFGSSATWGGATDGTLRLISVDNGTTPVNIAVSSRTSWAANTWYHIVGVYDGSQGQVYINGVQNGSIVSSSRGGGSTPATHAGIARDSATGENALAAILDDVRVYNRGLSAIEVAALYGSGAAAKKQANNNGLVGYWSFEDGSGTKATDFSGNGNTGTLTGAGGANNLPQWVTGRRGKALNFDGTDDYVRISGSVLNNVSVATISMWVRWNGTQSCFIGYCGPVVSRQKTSAWSEIFISLNGSNPDTAKIKISDNLVVSTTSPGSNQWRHVVAVLDASDCHIYIDGVLEASRGSTCGTSNNDLNIPLAIGGWIDDGNTYSSTSIDDLRIYNRALGSTEVATLYQSGAVAVNRAIAGPAASNLVLWHTFDGPRLNSTTSTDSSGQGNNASIGGTPVPVRGKIGQALSFDGTDDYVVTGSNVGISGDAAFTISAWVNPSNLSGGIATIAGLATGGGPGGNAALTINDNGAGAINLEMISCAEVTSGGVLSTGQWYHVVATKTPGAISSTATIYVNGVSQTHGNKYSNCTPNINAPHVNIGSGWEANDEIFFFPGSIDDVRIYNKALSASEVLQLYNLGK